MRSVTSCHDCDVPWVEVSPTLASMVIDVMRSEVGKGATMALADYILSKPVIETERLRLRPMRASDVPSLREWMADRSIYTYWGKGPSRTDKDPR